MIVVKTFGHRHEVNNAQVRRCMYIFNYAVFRVSPKAGGGGGGQWCTTGLNCNAISILRQECVATFQLASNTAIAKLHRVALRLMRLINLIFITFIKRAKWSTYSYIHFECMHNYIFYSLLILKDSILKWSYIVSSLLIMNGCKQTIVLSNGDHLSMLRKHSLAAAVTLRWAAALYYVHVVRT